MVTKRDVICERTEKQTVSKRTMVQYSKGLVSSKAQFLPKGRELQALVLLYILFSLCVILKVQLSQAFISIANFIKSCVLGEEDMAQEMRKSSWLSQPLANSRLPYSCTQTHFIQQTLELHHE